MTASSEQHTASQQGADGNVTVDQQERIAHIEQRIAPLVSGAHEHAHEHARPPTQ